MTSLRFVGDLPLWLGLAMALLVAFVSCRYYNRESFELPGKLKVILPLLRSTAFVLGILILTGPVLHHRTIIGELGQVKIFVDASSSMTQIDRHMALSRKLEIAHQLGWLSTDLPDLDKSESLQVISDARRELELSLENRDGASAEEILQPQAVSRFVETVNGELNSFAESERRSLEEIAVNPLSALAQENANRTSGTVSELQRRLSEIRRLESQLWTQVEQDLKVKISSENESLAAALDLFDAAPRWRRVELALGEGKLELLGKLRERHEVEVYFLHNELDDAAQLDLDQNVSFQPFLEQQFGQITNLSTAIAGSLNASEESESTSSRRTAIVLLSDGQHNDGSSPILTARSLGAQGNEYFNISIGSVRPAADLAILDVDYPQWVIANDQIRGSLTIRDSLSPGKPFVAQIRYQDKVLWQKPLISQDVRNRRIEFDFKLDELLSELDSLDRQEVTEHIRQLELEAYLTPLGEESESTNNSKPMHLSVVTEGYKVLILDGRSRWESRYIRNAFARDEQWEVDSIIAGKTTSHPTIPRGEEPDQFPTSRDQLFEYDLIVFGEMDLSLFEQNELIWIREFVEIRGGGVILIDGMRGKLRQLVDSEIEVLLPIASTLPAVPELPDHLELTAKGIELSALALALDQESNSEFWTELPAPHTFIPVEISPESETLAEIKVGEQKFPGIVSKRYGAGHVVYLAFDETWRWRYKAADTWHQRAWHQLAKFAMPQPYAVSDEFVSLDTGPASYKYGETPAIRVHLKDLAGKPNSDATVDALVWKNGKVVSTVNLSADPAIPGVYRGQAESLNVGDYEVSVRASGYSDSVLKSRGRFAVLAPDSGEMTETAVNEELLQQMAVESNGVYLREEELSKLPELLEPLSNGRVVESETLLWQSYWWFGAMMLLLSVEWILRKRSGLL